MLFVPLCRRVHTVHANTCGIKKEIGRLWNLHARKSEIHTRTRPFRIRICAYWNDLRPTKSIIFTVRGFPTVLSRRKNKMININRPPSINIYSRTLLSRKIAFKMISSRELSHRFQCARFTLTDPCEPPYQRPRYNKTFKKKNPVRYSGRFGFFFFVPRYSYQTRQKYLRPVPSTPPCRFRTDTPTPLNFAQI